MMFDHVSLSFQDHDDDTSPLNRQALTVILWCLHAQKRYLDTRYTRSVAWYLWERAQTSETELLVGVGLVL
jgi:hypothetical protein